MGRGAAPPREAWGGGGDGDPYTPTPGCFPLKALLMRKAVSKRRAKAARERAAPRTLEAMVQLLRTPSSIDSYYFNGFDARGNAAVLRLCRRAGFTEIWLLLRLEGLGMLSLPMHPHTSAPAPPGGASAGIAAAGLRFECVDACRAWRVSYHGALRRESDGALCHVAFDFDWAAATEPFDSDCSADTSALAAAMAREPWSREYFDDLRRAHQTHYEQWGDLSGVVRVEGEAAPRRVRLRGMRDHSTGERDWGRFHRYVCNFVSFEDGTHLEVVLVSMLGMTHLVTGYVVLPSGTTHAVTHCAQHLRELGEDGEPPAEYSLRFKTDAPGGAWRSLTCKVAASPHAFDMGGRARVHERIADFTLDGVRGVGVSEFMYRNKGVVPRPLGEAVQTAAVDVGIGAAARALPTSVALSGDLLCLDSSLVGGKAAGLARISAAMASSADAAVGPHVRVRVPRGRVLTVAAAEGAVRAVELDAAVGAIEAVLRKEIAGGGGDDTSARVGGAAVAAVSAELAAACERARAIFMGAGDEELVAHALAYRAEQDSDAGGRHSPASARVAVRSSSPWEDRGDASAAGMFESVLGVDASDTTAVLRAVRVVWASAYSAHCVRYRHARGLPLKAPVAVVVMDMVDAVKAAGVCFTQEPLAAGSEKFESPRVVLTANWGIGESVVSGEATPDAFYVTRPRVVAPPAPPAAGPAVALAQTILGAKETQRVVREGAGVGNGHAGGSGGGSAEPVGSVVREPVPEELRDVACMSPEECEAVAGAALLLENSAHFAGVAHAGGGLDVEFAVCLPEGPDGGACVHLLQARPVVRGADPPLTGGDDWHDVCGALDTAQPARSELLTRCNIGEMAPGALTPLTLSSFGWAVDRAMVDLAVRAGAARSMTGVARRMVHARAGHLFIDLHHMHLYCTFMGNDKRSADLNVCGREIEELPMEDVFAFHGGKRRFPWRKRLRFGLKFVGTMLGSAKRIQRVRENTPDLVGACAHDDGPGTVKRGRNKVAPSPRGSAAPSSPPEGAAALWKRIDDALEDYADAWSAHIAFSSRSGAWGTVLLTILAGGKGKDWRPEHYSDVARLLAHCGGVESADVPSALASMADSIASLPAVDAHAFAAMAPRDAHAWLQKKSPSSDDGTGAASGAASVRADYAAFIKRHGHRCVREAEIRVPSWAAAPQEHLIPALQATVKAKLAGAAAGSAGAGAAANDGDLSGDSDGLPTLQSNDMTRFGRFVLKRLLPTARRAVGQREWGKSTATRYHDRFKAAYAELGARLAREGALADADLVYFMTHAELGLLCGVGGATHTPPAAWLRARAARRRRAQPQLEGLSFAEMSRGMPEPEAVRLDEAGAQALVATGPSEGALRGYPVSHGRVTARARVVSTLADASSLEPGEIMVCPFTDVGWTPFFTIAGGLVTELGGLLSHGAVVAREFGLPCVVGVKGATRAFKSGDVVRLDGAEGTIERL